MAKRNTEAPKPIPVSFSELARRSGKNRSSITRLAQGALRAAVLADSRIDVGHSAVAAWARKHGINPRALLAGDPVADVAPRPRTDEKPKAGAKRRRRADDGATSQPEGDGGDDGEPTEELPELDAATIHTVRDMTLGQVERRYKTQTRFSGVLKNIKTSEEIRYKFLDNEEQEGRLIPREAVAKILFGGFDEFCRTLLGDFPKTLNAQLSAYAKADEPPEKGETFALDLIGTRIRAAKERMLELVEAL